MQNKRHAIQTTMIRYDTLECAKSFQKPTKRYETIESGTKQPALDFNAATCDRKLATDGNWKYVIFNFVLKIL